MHPRSAKTPVLPPDRHRRGPRQRSCRESSPFPWIDSFELALDDGGDAPGFRPEIFQPAEQLAPAPIFAGLLFGLEQFFSHGFRNELAQRHPALGGLRFRQAKYVVWDLKRGFHVSSVPYLWESRMPALLRVWTKSGDGCPRYLER